MNKEELEKEAEEYREEWQNKGYYFVSQEMEQIELDDIVDATFKDGAEFGYNKANEWHYVKDGDLPKDCKGKLYLVNIYSDSQLKFEYAEYTPTVCLWNPEWKRFEILELTVGSRIVNIRNIIAWKEIVLPELPKESE